jgi:hypothetical protein
LPSTTWHWVASNPAGTVLVAAVNPGNVFVSRDSGATWVASGLPHANWISLDMDATGQTMVAVAFGGGMYRSTDAGATWTRIDTAFNAGNNLQYESVTVSQDGQRVVATVLNGPIYVSATAAPPSRRRAAAQRARTAGAASTAPPTARSWSPSRKGRAPQPGAVHLSTDGGLTFALRPVPLGGRPTRRLVPRGGVRRRQHHRGGRQHRLRRHQHRPVRLARPGRHLGAGQRGSGTYTSIDMSANGDIIAATMSGATGQVLLSTNGGTSFTPITTPAGETNWRALAMNAAATRLILAAGTFTGNTAGVNGQVYLSSGTVAAPAAPAPALQHRRQRPPTPCFGPLGGGDYAGAGRRPRRRWRRRGACGRPTHNRGMTEPESGADEPIHEPRLWRDNGWTATVIKNEDDDGWAVAMTPDGQVEPALVGPWTMGRDKKNPKPLDTSAFNTLVKTAAEFVRRHEQQLHATLHQEVVIDHGTATA